jgi:hypothetical protein
VLPRDTATHSWGDAGDDAPEPYRLDGGQDEDQDGTRYSDGDELNDSDIDLEDSVQDIDFEDGGELIPDTFGPDPDDDYNHFQDDVDTPCGCDDDVNWLDDEGYAFEHYRDNDQRNNWSE